METDKQHRAKIFNRNVNDVTNDRLRETKGNRKEALKKEKQLYKDNWTDKDKLDIGSIGSRNLHRAVIKKLSSKNNKKVKVTKTKKDIKKGISIKKGYFIARDNKNKIIERRKVKGSKLTKEKAEERFKENGTFQDNVNVSRVRLTYFTEVSQFSTNKTKLKQPKHDAQYVMSCLYRGREITARSNKIGSPDTRNKKEAMLQCRKRFLALLNKEIEGKYEAREEVLNEREITDFKEGWVYYVKV